MVNTRYLQGRFAKQAAHVTRLESKCKYFVIKIHFYLTTETRRHGEEENH